MDISKISGFAIHTDNEERRYTFDKDGTVMRSTYVFKPKFDCSSELHTYKFGSDKFRKQLSEDLKENPTSITIDFLA